jgi:glycine betaine transporter
LFELSFKLFPFEGLTSWTNDWTLTFFLWWIAFGPCVGVFIARISRGRTLRQFMLGVVLVPTLFSVLWFAAFGGTALQIELFGGGGLGELVLQNYATAIFAFFEHFPASIVLNLLALLLVFIFLVTTADSGCFVVAMLTSNGTLNPPLKKKLLWTSVITVITAATVLSSGGVEAAKAIAIFGAIPFTIILILQIFSFLLVLGDDPGISAAGRGATGERDSDGK